MSEICPRCGSTEWADDYDFKSRLVAGPSDITVRACWGCIEDDEIHPVMWDAVSGVEFRDEWCS